MASKSWVYTLNNYTQENVDQFKAFTVKRHRCALEDEGTPHMQGSITFTRAYRLAQLKKLCPKAHWEIAKCKDSENYCTKGEIIIDVNNTKQGSRTDLQQAIDTVKSSYSLQIVAEEHPETYVKYYKGLQALRKELQPRLEKFTQTTVSVFIGKPGTGKTRKVYEMEPKVYLVPEPVNGILWFDGYEGQEAILFDDFYGWVKYHTMLNILDGYPMQMPVKGSHVYRNWTRVYITSNSHPREWYQRTEWNALKRRINLIKEI